MDVTEIRRKNIRYLADVKYGRMQLSELIGYQDANYLNQLCGGFGNFGNRTARKIESKLGLDHGWMDNSHAEIVGENSQVKESLRDYQVGPSTTPDQFSESQLELLKAYLEAPESLRGGIRRLLDLPE